MKKLIYIGAILALFALPACQDDISDGIDCKYCHIEVYDADGNLIDQTAPIEYCGDELDGIDGVSETDPDGNTTKYVCEMAYK